MKAGIFFTGSGPILVLTTYDSFTEPEFLNKLDAKGIKKFVVRAQPLGLMPGLSYDNIEELLDVAEGPLRR